ncbi:AI-2E family transporter [Halorubellus litoreus]|uniref:AI-2E family transporter n=1 Tax=Halorubellus litoreus TaxID=755308 RepID=A0ABD5V7T5_9EURY
MTEDARADEADDARREEPGRPGSSGEGVASRVSNLGRDRVALWVVAFAFAVAFAFIVWQYVGTVVVGVFAYYVSRPVFNRLVHPRIRSRTLAVAATLLTVGLPVLALVAWTVLVAIRSLADVLDSDLGGQLAALVEPYADLNEIFTELSATARTILSDPTQLANLELGSSLTQVLDLLLGTVGQLFNVLLHAFIVLIITFYLLRDDYRLAAWGRATFVPEGGVLESYFVAVDRDLKNVYFGNILNALLTGFLAVVTFVALNVVSPASASIPEPVLVGLLVGVASLVPVIGIKLVTLPLAAYLFALVALEGATGLWFPVTFLVVSFVVVDYIPDQLLRPYVSGRTLHVGAVMLAYTLGPVLFGWYGIFLGPLVLVFLFEFARIVVPWLVDPDAPTEFASPPEPEPLAPGDDADDVDDAGDADDADGEEAATDASVTESVDAPSGTEDPAE